MAQEAEEDSGVTHPLHFRGLSRLGKAYMYTLRPALCLGRRARLRTLSILSLSLTCLRPSTDRHNPSGFL